MRFKDKWLYFPVIILFIHFIYRLIDQSKILRIFPLDYTNDWASYMTQLFFLDKCGYYNFCPYWYNGIITFKSAPPGWYFFTFPLYKVTGSVLVAAFSSLIIMLILAFIAIYIFGRKNNFSFIKISAFFILFFGNAVAIGNFIRLGRVNELFAWVSFIPLAFIVLLYKDKEIDRNFFWIIPFLSIIILSHQTTSILSSILILGLFIIKKRKERFIIISTAFISFLLTSFWSIPYILNFFNTEAVNIILTENLFSFDKSYLLQNIAVWLVSVVLFVVFYFYWKSNNKSKKEILFFSPTLLLAILLISGLTFYIPILRFVYPDSHIYFFMFLLIYMLFKIDYSVIDKKVVNFLIMGLTIFPLLSVGINLYHTPNFIEYDSLEIDTLEVLNRVDDRFIILTDQTHPTSYSRAYYSYAAIYLDKSTSSGYYQQYVTKDYFSNLINLNNEFRNEDSNLIYTLNNLNTTNIISYDNGCDKLNRLGFQERFKKGRVCLYTT
ncbi:hypothetical protein HYX15_01840 [Candidatus Woesearchaeota archaeon]|nr:hypothetical protein [Candidatus Woesearchaeota archaeon]